MVTRGGRRHAFFRHGKTMRCIVAAITALLGAATGAAPVPAAEFHEYQVKAAFLYNFAKFVTWPDSKLHEGGDHFVLCILGSDPFDGNLDETVRGKTAQGKQLAVLRLRTHDVQQCHILFVSEPPGVSLPALLDQAHNAHVLTVGDFDGFAADGGAINFRLATNKIRFEINAGAAEQAGLRLSSQLLKLAERVIDSPAALR